MKKGINSFLSKTAPYLHWLVLLVAILIAASTWIAWSSFGALYVRSLLLSSAASTAVTSKVAETPTLASDVIAATTAQTLTEFGQVGDSFGGLNALLTAFAGAFVFWAGFMQHQALKEARQEAERERDYRRKQEFESLLFQLLSLCAVAAEKVHRKTSQTSSVDNGVRRGSRALDSYAASIYSKVNPEQVGATPDKVLKKLITTFYTTAYDRNPSAFGPYYRMLLQVFRHIVDSGLSEKAQQRYASIARGQISEGAVLLLALYGLSKAGREFHPLIEKFNLLTHIHRRHFKAYSTALLLGYRATAFNGTEGVPNASDRNQPTPLLLQDNYFDDIEADREKADAVADFDSGYDPNSPTDE
ncbi:putative phage abortive infection protein [Duganella sp. PWIR1]